LPDPDQSSPSTFFTPLSLDFFDSIACIMTFGLAVLIKRNSVEPAEFRLEMKHWEN